MSTPPPFELQPVLDRLTTAYRSGKRSLARIEKKFLETPSRDLEIEVVRSQGVLKGILKAIDLVQERLGDNWLPGLDK